MLGRAKLLMPERYEHAVTNLLNNWVLEFQIAHRFKSRVEPFTDILIWGISEFIEQTDNLGVSCCPLFKYICDGDMTRQGPWALDFDAIVKYSDMNIVVDTIITVNRGVRYNFMDRFGRILDSLQSCGS
jgi:hypothetical protein